MRLLVPALENRLGRVARLRHPRPVDLRLGLGLVTRRPAVVAAAPLQNMRAHTLGFIHFDGARMRLLLRYADFRESVKDRLALYFQLPR
jgi:hypothetical protein